MKTGTISFLSIWILICLLHFDAQAQSNQDTTNLPKISIQSLNGYGPYTLGDKRSNYIMAYDLPTNTREITFKIIDSKGQQVNKPHTVQGHYLEEATWQFDSDSMDFPLSPKLSVEVYYQGDSIAQYFIPYLIYPDTIWFESSAGWGPFISNDYALADTSWNKVPAKYTDFSVTNLPPRCDTVIIRICKADSSVIDSLVHIAPSGQYLDSAHFSNYRLDSLSVSTAYAEIAVYAEGGPPNGIRRQKELDIDAQKARIRFVDKNASYQDTIPPLTQNHRNGKILLIDTVNYAEILNGPGIPQYHIDGTYYKGPLSIDIIREDFTIESWLKFNWNEFQADPKAIYIMNVDSLWNVRIASEYGGPSLYFSSMTGGEEKKLIHATLPKDVTKNWHHLAFSYQYMVGSNRHVKVYWDGKELSNESISIFEDNYFDIENSPYYKNLKTKPLHLGSTPDPYYIYNANLITAMDEVRIWSYARTASEIAGNYNQEILQSESLVGYWNFDDKRNFMKTIVDLSYENNTGQLKNNASFAPQDIEVEHFSDSLIVYSSAQNTDSIQICFIDNNNSIHFERTMTCADAKAVLFYDLSELPASANRLITYEYNSDWDSASISIFPIEIKPPSPIAAPKYNWGRFYQSDEYFPQLYNYIDVSNFPSGTYKAELGLECNGHFFEKHEYSSTSIPFQYSVSLNGKNNYIQTNEKIKIPTNGYINFWFKTSTDKGGRLICFSTTKSGVNSTRTERNIYMMPDGSIRFVLNSDYTLYAEHAYNDGQWHQIEVSFGAESADISIDGCIVDQKFIGYLDTYTGYWLIGRYNAGKDEKYRELNEYFKGSLSQISIHKQEPGTSQTLLKLDEGTGQDISDSHGNNNAKIMGDAPAWFKNQDDISHLKWKGNMANKKPGTYTFYARVYCANSPDSGLYYPLGRFSIENPVPGHKFDYYFTKSLGFFNEGVLMLNEIEGSTDYTSQNKCRNWKNDYLRAVFLSPDHLIIKDEYYSYTEPLGEYKFSFDMGDAPVGSYISFQLGSMSDSDTTMDVYFSVPIYINRIIQPTMKGYFGPFEQAIAPGVMAQNNTFTISTEHLDDLTKITGRFTNEHGTELGSTQAVQKNDTTWELTYPMGTLSPPKSFLYVDYYLGDNPHPVLTDGPHAITIIKTRPFWFDFIEDDHFYNIEEKGDKVTFEIETYLSKDNRTVVTRTFIIPKGIPLLGGTNIKTGKKTVRARLEFTKSTNTLGINGDPKFQNTLFKFKVGPPEIVDADFQMKENDYYYLDDNNDLIATQNFATSLDLTWSIKRLVENPITEFIKLYKALRIKDWSEVKPVGLTANFTVSPTIGYASRLHFKMDSTNGVWGSYGKLKIDANPAHHAEYNNSASYYFAYIGMNNELSIGLTFGGGLVDVYAAIALGLYGGIGDSYIDIPKRKNHFILASVIQLYFRVYLTALWNWYEVDLYGPKPIHRWSIGDDDMRDCIPPFEGDKKFKLDSNLNASLYLHKPVGYYSKIPLPTPQHAMGINGSNNAITWLEPGSEYGKRKICLEHLNFPGKTFGKKIILEENDNAPQKAVSEFINDSIAICSWMQSRHNPQSIRETDPDNILENIARSHDIYYAVYNSRTNEVLQKIQIEDLMNGYVSGRAEGNPKICKLNDHSAMLCWQVANMENNTSQLWYTIISNDNGQWVSEEGRPFASPGGIQSNLNLACPEEGTILAVWKNYEPQVIERNRLLYSLFEGDEWSNPEPFGFNTDSIHYNYLDLDFENSYGACLFSTYDIAKQAEKDEALYLKKWNFDSHNWAAEEAGLVHADSLHHIELPSLDIREDGEAVIAFKRSRPGLYDMNRSISQIDVLSGHIDEDPGNWNTFAANPYVCDTTKQVSELSISFTKGDSVILLCQEFTMTATNMPYRPTHGIRFGNPLMNLVFRAFEIKEDRIIDIVESGYFTPVTELPLEEHDISLGQNFPNPCSNETSITFYIPDEAPVLFELYDISGKKVSTLIDETLSAGAYDLKINTSELESGFYFCRLTKGKIHKSRKIIVKH